MLDADRGFVWLALSGLVLGSTPLLATAQLAAAPACALLDETRGSVWLRVLEVRKMDDDDAKRALRALQDSLAAEAPVRPEDVRVQYELALVLGLLADIEGGSERVRIAEALDHQARVVLALEPDHPGAQHLLGRLYAAVMRMNRFRRFVATRILGADRLAGASWEEARVRLEAAADGDPCVPDHHYELARLYHERGDLERAALQLDRFQSVTGSRELYAEVIRKAEDLAEELAEDLAGE